MRKAHVPESCNGDTVMKGQMESEQGCHTGPSTACGLAKNRNSSNSSFCTGRSMHNKLIIVYKTKHVKTSF